MKYAILFIIIFFILALYKFFKYSGTQKKDSIDNDEKIIDLEKDPKTNEYKPKE